MITIERHHDADEIWLLDTEGSTHDLQVIIEDNTIFFTQDTEDAGMQVIQITPEQLGNLFVSMQLEPGVYEVEGTKVQKATRQ